MYKVLEGFADLKDDNYRYLPGDTYPREGLVVDQSRLDELASDKNKRGRAVIEMLMQPPLEPVIEEPVIEPVKKRRGRKKNAD